jgi:hypothetical protein
VNTIATAVAALALSASTAVLAQPTGAYDQSQPYPQGQDQGSQGQGYQGYGAQGRSYQGPQGQDQGPQGQDQGYPGQAGPANPGQAYQGQGYQGQGYPPPTGAPNPGAPAYGQPPPAGDDNQQGARQYDRSEDAYEQRLREYQHERREYERQRAAYDAQFGGGSAGAYAPPPPPPPPPPAPAYGSWRDAGSSFYRYSDTVPFQDGPWNYGGRGAGWYRGHGCRLAAPHDDPSGDPGRFIPVCPDEDGRYRPA